MPPIPRQNGAKMSTPRGIRRACSKELYRTIKRLKIHVPDELLEQGEELYYRTVIEHLNFISENRSNRKLLCDWWDEHVCGELATLWQIDETKLKNAFRDAFGG